MTSMSTRPEQGIEAYLERPLTPPPPATLAALESGPCTPADALLLGSLDRLTDPEPLLVENGWCRLPDGSGYVAVRTEMPGITGEMVEWWFDWHPRRPERYRAWHPTAHLDNSVELPAEPGAKPFWGAVHHAVEDIGEGPIRARIHFLPPVDFGFSGSACESDGVATILCATVGDRRVSQHSLMAHVFLEVDGGLMLRSHFWLASVIRPRVLNTRFIRRRLLRDSTVEGLARHCAEEYTNLAAILPQLYERFREKQS